MKNLLMVSNGEHYASRLVKTALLAFTALALAMVFLAGSAPKLSAQNMSPEKMLQAQLPAGTSVQTAEKADFLAAVAAAVRQFRSASPQIVRTAVEMHRDWSEDILRAAFQALGSNDCPLLSRVLRAAIAGNPDAGAALTSLAAQLAPECAASFPSPGTGGGDEGNYPTTPGNLNPPPGSIGGGGGQGNVVAVCINGVTRFFSPEGAQEALRNNPGARLGACVVTPVQNR